MADDAGSFGDVAAGPRGVDLVVGLFEHLGLLVGRPERQCHLRVGPRFQDQFLDV